MSNKPLLDYEECPTCRGGRGGYVRRGEDWEWEPCDICKEAGYVVAAGEGTHSNAEA